MAAALSDTATDIIKVTVPALEAHGLAITQRMYARMFEDREIRDLFNQSHHGDAASQPRALAPLLSPTLATSITLAFLPLVWSALRRSMSA